MQTVHKSLYCHIHNHYRLYLIYTFRLDTDTEGVEDSGRSKRIFFFLLWLSNDSDNDNDNDKVMCCVKVL